MGTVFLIVIGIIGLFSALFYFGSNKSEDSAKMGAAVGFQFILQLIPLAVIIAIIVFIIKSCS